MFISKSDSMLPVPLLSAKPINTIFPTRPPPPSSLYKNYFIKPQSKILCKRDNMMLKCFKYSVVNDRHFFRSNIRKNDKCHIITTIADDAFTLVNSIDKKIIQVIQECIKQIENNDFSKHSFNYKLILDLLDKLNDETPPDKLKYFVIKTII
jgi:hypothetical protein